MKSTPIRVALWTTVFGLVLAVVFVGIIAYRTSMDAEYALHAYWLVLGLVSDHVEKTAGKWPQSWEDLYDHSVSRSAVWRWPDDHKKIEARVRIDFSLTCNDVGKMSPETFRAIGQRTPNYGPEFDELQRLIRLCQHYSAADAAIKPQELKRKQCLD